jgi:hypothetical protein
VRSLIVSVVILIGPLVFLSGCGPGSRNEKVIRQAFDSSEFDMNVAAKLPLYDSLRTFLFANLDTIMGFRNSRNYYSVYDEDYKKKTGQDRYNSVKHDEPDYTFSLSADDYPAPVFKVVDSIVSLIGRDKISSFTIGWDYDKHPKLWEIELKYFYIEGQRTTLSHHLHWSESAIDSSNFRMPEWRTEANRSGLKYWVRREGYECDKSILLTPRWEYHIGTDGR